MIDRSSKGNRPFARSLDAILDFILNKIKNWLLNKIEAGQLSRGDVLPSEAHLRGPRVSRATDCQAGFLRTAP